MNPRWTEPTWPSARSFWPTPGSHIRNLPTRWAFSVNAAHRRISALVEEARASEHGESYRNISKGNGFMLGVGARSKEREGEYFLEGTVQLCRPSAEVDIESIEGALPLLRELRSRGYSIECREGSVTCERVLAASELGAELELVSAATHYLK